MRLGCQKRRKVQVIKSAGGNYGSRSKFMLVSNSGYRIYVSYRRANTHIDDHNRTQNINGQEERHRL